MNVYRKLSEWVSRYFFAEVTGITTMLFASLFIYFATGSGVAAAFAGTWGENIGYYGFMSTREVYHSRKHYKKTKKSYGFLAFLKNIRNLVLEFGPAETLDSFVIRPFCMYIFPVLLDNVVVGLIVGKVVADLTFYIPTVIAYELRKKYLEDEMCHCFAFG